MIGAGPIGCRVSELVSRRGFKTILIDKKEDVGTPVQCTGLVSHRLKRIVTDLPDNVILNELNSAKFYYDSDEFEIKSKKPFYVIDREKFDKFMFLKARQSGVEIKLQTEFKDFEIRRNSSIGKTTEGLIIKEDSVFVNTDEGKLQTKLLVGADGPISTVASKANLMRPSNILTGVQTTVSGNFDVDSVELHFSSDISPDFFGWVVPINSKKARIGLASKKDSLNRLKTFVNLRTDGNVNKSDVKPDVVGRINFGLMNRTSSERILTVGDAACQVKPFSGGGVIYGLIGAGYCSNACIRALTAGNFSHEYLQNEYDKKWKSHLKIPIKKGMIMRTLLSGSDEKMNLMLSMAKRFQFLVERLDVDIL